MKGITHKKLKSILNEAAFNPQKPTGTLKIILESGDANYFEQRAIELVYEARNIILDSELAKQQYHEKINNAIGLLALARLHNTISNDYKE